MNDCTPAALRRRSDRPHAHVNFLPIRRSWLSAINRTRAAGGAGLERLLRGYVRRNRNPLSQSLHRHERRIFPGYESARRQGPNDGGIPTAEPNPRRNKKQRREDPHDEPRSGERRATLVADGKGILAADETVPTLTKRFDTLGIQSTEQSRRTTGKCSLPRLAPPSSSAASSCMTKPSARRVPAARRSPRLSQARASFPASRSIPARSPSPALPTRRSPRGSTGYGIASRSTAAWAPVSRSGGRSSMSRTLCRVPPA